MDVTKYSLDQNEIEVPEEPQPTTSVIPFAKEDIVGRSIHMIYELDDTYYFFKGKVVSYDEKTSMFSVNFWDGDSADITFVSGGDTILWETRDITRDGTWMEDEVLEVEKPVPKQKEEKEPVPKQKEEKDPVPKQKEEKDPVTKQKANEPVPKQKEKEPVPKPQESVKMHAAVAQKPVVDVAPRSNNVEKVKHVDRGDVGLKRKIDARHQSQEGPLAKKKVVEQSPRTVQKTEEKSKVVQPSIAPKVREPGPAVSKNDVLNLKDEIDSVGREFLGCLKSLKASIDNVNRLARKLEIFCKTRDITSADQTLMIKHVKGVLYRTLKEKKDKQATEKEDIGLEAVWPLNDCVLNPFARLHAVAVQLCEKANMPHKLDQNDIDRWRQGQKVVKKVEEQTALVTPAKLKQLGSPPAQRSDMKPPKAPKVDWETFTSTGNSTRDDAIKIFAHSLMSTETPFELAVDIEQALHAKYSNDGETLGEDYYRSIKGIWEILHPASSTCHPIVRMMILGGHLKATDLISLSSQECNEKQKAFLDTLIQQT